MTRNAATERTSTDCQQQTASVGNIKLFSSSLQCNSTQRATCIRQHVVNATAATIYVALVACAAPLAKVWGMWQALVFNTQCAYHHATTYIRGSYIHIQDRNAHTLVKCLAFTATIKRSLNLTHLLRAGPHTDTPIAWECMRELNFTTYNNKKATRIKVRLVLLPKKKHQRGGQFDVSKYCVYVCWCVKQGMT